MGTLRVRGVCVVVKLVGWCIIGLIIKAQNDCLDVRRTQVAMHCNFHTFYFFTEPIISQTAKHPQSNVYQTLGPTRNYHSDIATLILQHVICAKFGLNFWSRSPLSRARFEKKTTYRKSKQI